MSVSPSKTFWTIQNVVTCFSTGICNYWGGGGGGGGSVSVKDYSSSYYFYNQIITIILLTVNNLSLPNPCLPRGRNTPLYQSVKYQCSYPLVHSNTITISPSSPSLQTEGFRYPPPLLRPPVPLRLRPLHPPPQRRGGWRWRRAVRWGWGGREGQAEHQGSLQPGGGALRAKGGRRAGQLSPSARSMPSASRPRSHQHRCQFKM